MEDPEGEWRPSSLGGKPKLATDGSSNGGSFVQKGAGRVMEFYFLRRKDHGTSGSVRYTVQFSTDPSDFTDSGTVPTWVADSDPDSTN
ncbi:hypothetical protein DDZ13_07765 [Coraliomargarita sinensis]|uniref:Uncharacterized protein n=1 Tax=Coraliomargarita sinensis TaxID=2174842 RepID=A0A317ZKS7_9BACT|nr:hypothetical protein [Coraliomargarita sinensis]PXA04419.1 hypothetical protein DDZ13_07765 [Coraliomargarita sinensis]